MVGEEIAAADESNGYFAVEFRGNGSSPIIIRPDDTVVVYAAQTITVPVTPLSATADNTTDRVSGVGPAGQDLDVFVWTNGFWGERTVTTAADGSYTADFSGTVDVRPSSWVSVAHFNEDGNEVWTGSYAPLVRINVSSDIVDGYATPNASASLVLKRGGSPVASTSAPTGIYGDFSTFFLDGAGNLVDLVAGDVVEVTASPTVTTAAITLTASVEAGSDTVSGEGPAFAPVLVVAYRCTPDGGCSSAEMTAIASDAGIYVANFAGVFDLDLTSYAYVQAADAEGNETSIATTPPETPQLQDVQDGLLAAGAKLLHSFYGTANRNNLTPPQVFNLAGGGRLIFIARGGDIVVTAPDGTIDAAGKQLCYGPKSPYRQVAGTSGDLV